MTGSRQSGEEIAALNRLRFGLQLKSCMVCGIAPVAGAGEKT
jgi:hypothetical protein